MKFDLARRAVMKALLGSPIAAKSVVDAAASEALGKLSAGGSFGGSAAVECVESDGADPLDELFFWHQRRMMGRINRRRNNKVQKHMPVSVATKKSWSPAFKAHVTQQQMDEAEMWDDYLPEGKIRALVSIGVLPKSLLGED